MSGTWAYSWLCRDCVGAPRLVNVRFGIDSEWAEFERRRGRFIDLFTELRALIDQVVSRSFTPKDTPQRVVFFLGRLAVEDVLEIVMNAGTGYGAAAFKPLRPMFERAITMMYLIRNPRAVDDFLAHRIVEMRKVVNHIRGAGDEPEGYFATGEVATIETEYQALEGKFKGMLRLAQAEGGLRFKAGAQHQEADSALWGAHLCLTYLLKEHARYFELPSEIAVRSISLLRACWPGKPDGEDRTP